MPFHGVILCHDKLSGKRRALSDCYPVHCRWWIRKYFWLCAFSCGHGGGLHGKQERHEEGSRAEQGAGSSEMGDRRLKMGDRRRKKGRFRLLTPIFYQEVTEETENGNCPRALRCILSRPAKTISKHQRFCRSTSYSGCAAKQRCVAPCEKRIFFSCTIGRCMPKWTGL